MENNLGSIDRWIRLIIGVILLVIAFASHLASGWLSYAAIGSGMAFFSTSVAGICPVYRILRLKTT